MKQLVLLSAAAICAATLATSRLPAQASTALTPGARVRLITPRLESSQQIVRVITATRDSVEFRSDGYPVTRSLAISDLSAIEVASTSRRPFLRNMLVGGGVGALVGGVVGYATYEDSNCEIFCIFDTTRGQEAALSGSLLGTIGVVVGAGIAAFQDRERWTRIPLDATVAVHPAKGGRVAFTIARTF
ncbi:MAG: hypothetical protein H0T21_00510 [Gemmatimonadaceae bacterium]|nr:hypothetical protein [Gemmatimonadaceae bacterium]